VLLKRIADMGSVVEVCRRRAIVFPAAEIYGGAAGFFDYGPVGASLKRKVIDYWREFFVREDRNVVEMDGATVLPEAVFAASGHTKGFTDPVTQCAKCRGMYRADHLVEEATGKFVEGYKPGELDEEIRKLGLKCPKCGGGLGKVRVFNLMLSTEISPVGGQTAYMRPETAQNIFINFRRIFTSMRGRFPYGIAQVGHSFRNEISPRQFMVRVREFTQMEIEMFMDPAKMEVCPLWNKYRKTRIALHTRETQKKGKEPVVVTAEGALKQKMVPARYMAYYMAKEMKWYESLGIPREHIRFRHMLPEETPHYSKGNFDMEIRFDFGWKETVGNSLRGDYDLSSHTKHSRKDLSIDVDGHKVMANAVEPSFGVERTLNGILLHCYRSGEERGWNWFAFPPRIAPYTAGVFPLMNKDGLPKRAREIEKLLSGFDVLYDDSGSIGKRYARMDEIGTPLCITVDYETRKDSTVTIRDRDTTKQRRVKIRDLPKILDAIIKGEKFGKFGRAIK
jgi:glycyl-tRNA synthetase